MASNDTIIAANGKTLLAKLCFESKARLAEVEVTIEAVRRKMDEYYGPDAANGQLEYALRADDPDRLQLVTDADVALAERVGAQPLKIVSVVAARIPTAMPVAAPRGSRDAVEADDGRDVFQHASAALGRNGLEADPTEIAALLRILDLRPRRLVKCGLAPPKALKFTPAGDEEEDVEDIQLVEALSLEDTEADAAKACCNKEKADKSCCNKGHDHKFFYHKEEDTDAALAAKLQAEEYGQADVVLEAVTAQGVRLDGKCLHALLRMLHCRPARFVKLGLVDDVKAARQAYKSGGKACAKEWFRNKGGKGGGKGWGRGMHGRGAGWAFEESWAEESRWGRRGGKGCHGKGRESRGGHGCHGKGRSESRGGRGCHGRSWGPPPPADPRGCGRW